MVRLLVISDEVDRALTVTRLKEMSPDVVISCGDLPPDYLDYVGSAANVPLLYVPGNHDPDAGDRFTAGAVTKPPRPPGISLDGRIVTEHGLRIAGLGGSLRYRPGPNQYTQTQMRRRVKSMIRSARLRGLGRLEPIDVLVTHAPPLGEGDDQDSAHRGFDAFHHLIETLHPRLMVHGHLHPYGFPRPDRKIGDTRIVNVIPHKLLEV